MPSHNPRESRELALLVLATLLIIVYLLKGWSFYPAEHSPQTHLENRPVYVEVNGEGVYTFEGKDSEVLLQDAIKRSGIENEVTSGVKVKTGARVTIRPDDLETGIMDGEKHITLGIPLDINKATAEDLEALSGIGRKLAERIVEMRERLGGFKSIDELKEVRGIGERKLEGIRRYIIVSYIL